MMCLPNNFICTRHIKNIALFLLMGLAIYGCRDDYTPKPKGYFRIELPSKSYQLYQSGICPFQFEYPVYGVVVRDTLFFNEPTENPCWLNLNIPDFGGTVHLSYKAINKENSLDQLIEDAHKLTFKHTIKAEYIDESIIQNEHGVSGILYEIGGNTASNIQFFVTDSIRNYLRGSLYFKTIPNEDSLSPVIQFVKTDLMHLIRTFQWTEDK